MQAESSVQSLFTAYCESKSALSNSHSKIIEYLKSNPLLVINDSEASIEILNKPKLAKLVVDLDEDLLKFLMSNDLVVSLFFKVVNGLTVFNQSSFIDAVFNTNEYLSSKTKFNNKIELACEKGAVVLNYPFKDCVLVGNLDSAEQGAKVEKFYNEVLDKNSIDKLFSPKLLSNSTKITVKDGVATESVPLEISDQDNLVIKGNNLIALHTLKSKFKGKVDVIYIDPPYFFKQGRDGDTFMYNSSFKLSSWLTFLKNRLQIAKNLLSDTGVLYLHVGEDGLEHIKLVASEIFDEENFISMLSRVQKKGSDKGTYFKPVLDYILVFAKDKSQLKGFKQSVDLSKFKLVETDGPRKGELYESSKSLYQSSLDSRPNQRYYVKCPDNSLAIPPGNVFPSERLDGAFITPESNQDKVWRWARDTYLDVKDTLLVFKKTKNSPLVDENGVQSKWNVYTKRYASDAELKGNIPSNLISEYPNSMGTDTLSSLNIDFAFSKPVELVKKLIAIHEGLDQLVLDFFAGSGTTGHAVLELNKEDGGNRRFILVEQLDYASSLTLERIKKASIKYAFDNSVVYSEVLKSDVKSKILGAETISDIVDVIQENFDYGYFQNVTDKRELLDAILTQADVSVVKKGLIEHIFDHNMEYVSADLISEVKLTESDIFLNDSFFKE